MDTLPVSFASQLCIQQDGSIDRIPLNNAINTLAKIIWKKSGFRFWHRRTDWDDRRYIYFCSQDAERVPPSEAKGKRDAPRMERFSCQSHLSFRPSLEDRTLAVSLRHTYHMPYEDHQLSTEVLEFIQARNAFSTPAEIYRDLQAAQPSGWDLATSQQVYYQWQQSNSNVWRRDLDPLVSAQKLLSEHSECTSSTYFAGNMRAIAFYISDSVRNLASCTKELAIDATFGTNNMAMNLFAVLAEVDGTGVPLAYCFMDTFKDNTHGVRRAEPGAATAILDQFLRPLQGAGFEPTFFGMDKDFSEIVAIRQVWPKATIQLCYWHARRAIRMKLTSSRQTNTQAEYRPLEGQMLIPDLEICWGSMPTSRLMETIDMVVAIVPQAQRILSSMVEWKHHGAMSKIPCLISFLDTTIPIHSSLTKMVHTNLQSIFIVPVPRKCITGADRAITSDYGPTFGSIGISQASGLCGHDQPTERKFQS
jgi:hypothetical protein